MITIRLMGTPEEVAALTACVGALVEVLEESSDDPNRGHAHRVRRREAMWHVVKRWPGIRHWRYCWYAYFCAPGSHGTGGIWRNDADEAAFLLDIWEGRR